MQFMINWLELCNLGDGVNGLLSMFVFVDGYCLFGMGICQMGLDVDVIVVGVIECVEIVIDGGLFIYGLDVVGGVINFIMCKCFDGVEVKVWYGFVDNYDFFDVELTVGKDWGNFLVWVLYNYLWYEVLYGFDLDYVQW